MRLSSLCIWLLLFYGTPVDSDEVNLLEYSGFGPCDVTLTPEEPCEQEGDEINCPYLFNVPPLTIHLPKQLRELERIVDELQTLKDNVDELRRMCADCTVRQTGRECDRESEAVNEGKNRKKDQGNWLNADSLKDFSLEHGTKRVKSGNRSDSYSEREVEKIILEQENKGGSVGQNTTGEINEEIRGDGKQGVSITGTVHTQRAKEQDKWTAKAGGNGKFVDLVIESTDEINSWGKTDDGGNDMNGKENSRGDREYMLENGEESIVLGDFKSLEKPHPHLGQDRINEMEKNIQSKETGSSKAKNMSNFHNKDTDKRQQQLVEEQKKEMEKGIIVEQGNEKLRGASKKGEEEKKETGQENKTKGEKLIQSTQTDGDSGLASSKDTARTNYASKGQTPYISAEGSRQEPADSNAALSYRSSHGSPAFSNLTPPLTRVHKGLTTTAAGPQIQTTDLSATFIAEPGFTATGRPTTAPVNTGQQGFTEPHRVVRPTTATTTTTNGPTIATLPGVSQHHHSPAKLNISSNTKTGVKPSGTNPKIKTAKVNNSPKPAQGLFSDKKTKYDQKQKPPYHKPLTKPRFKGSQLFQGLKPSQRTDISPADLNLKENPTNQNQPNIQTPKSPSKLPVQRPMSHRRHQPVKMNNPEKHLPTEQKPKSTQITNVTQNEKISNSEKQTIHLLKMERTLKKSAIEEKRKQNQTPEITHGLRDIEGRDIEDTENKQKTNFTPQLFHEADAELLENADGPLAETKNVSSGQKVTPSPIPIKLFNQSQTTNVSLNVIFEPGKMSKINHQGPEPEMRSGSNVSAELQQTDTEEGLGDLSRTKTPRFSSTPVSERNPEAQSSNTPLSKQRSHPTPIDTPQAERSKPSIPIKPISKTDPDLDPLQMARATLDPFQPSQTSTPPSPGSAKSFAVVNIDPGETEVSSIEVETQYSKTITSLESGAKPHLNTLAEDFMLSPDSRKTSDQKPQTSAPTPSIQAATTSHRVTPGLLPSDFHESVLLYSKPKNDGESKHEWEDKQVQLSKPDNGSFSDGLPTDQRTQIPEHIPEQLFIRNTKPHQKTTPPTLRPTGGLTDLLPEADKTSRTDQKSNPGLTTADIHRSETNHKPDGWSVSTATQQPENTQRLSPKLPHVMTPLTGIMENSVNSEAGSKPVLPDPNPDSRKKFLQIKPKPAPAPKTGLNQSDPDLTTDSEAEHNLESDKTSHIDRGFKPPLPDLIPNPTVKPVSDGAPGAEYDRIPSPLPRHRSPSTPTAEPGATSAQRSTPFFPLKSGSKPKTSGPVQNSQMILPPSSGPVKQLDDVTNSWVDTEVSTIKMTTLDLKSSISPDGRAIPHLHTLPGDFVANPNSRIMSRQKSQTTAAPPSIQVTDRPNRLIPWVLSSVPPSDSPTQQKQAANVDSKLHHNQEETTKSQIYDSNKVMNTIPSSSSADLRSTNPANSGPQPLAPDVSTDSARELRVKINQVAAFFNNSRSTSGRHPERHSAEQPEDKQRGSRLDGINSKLLTRIPSKVTVVMRDCSDYLLRRERKSGVYIVTPDLRSKSFPVFCDMELLGGGWTLLQRRQDGSVSFNRTWAEYRSGFGELDGGEFWLGNNMIHLLTRERDMMLRVELEDFEGEKGFAEYSQFRVASERLRYTLTVGGYSGNAGNALRFSKSYDHNHRAFTTLDRDHDRYPSGNCAAYYSSGWWFDACMAANLNGRYYTGSYKGVRDGIYWGTWHNISSEYYPTNNRQSFKSVRMMIRPKGFMSKTTQS